MSPHEKLRLTDNSEDRSNSEAELSATNRCWKETWICPLYRKP